MPYCFMGLQKVDILLTFTIAYRIGKKEFNLPLIIYIHGSNT